MWRYLYFALLLVSVGLRVWALWASPLWYDEIFTVALTSLPFGRLIAATAADVHPPLFYAIAWVAAVAGIGARWVSVVAGVATVALVYPTARRFELSPRAALLATAAAAILPVQVYYSQEARQYALLSALVVGAMWAGMARRWWVVSLLGAAMVWTHVYGWVYLAAVALIVWIDLTRDPHHPLHPTAVVAVLVGFPVVAFLPWAGVLANQVVTSGRDWWALPTTPGAVAYLLYWVGWFALSDQFSSLAALVAYGVLLATAAAALRAARGRVALVAGWVLVPLVLVLVLGVVYRPVWLPRAFLPITYPIYMLIAWAVDRASRPAQWAAAAALVPLVLVGVLTVHRESVTLRAARTDMRPIDIMADEMRPGDVVYNVGAATWLKLKYITAPQWVYAVMPTVPGSQGVLSNPTLEALGAPVVAFDDLTAPRVWIVWASGPTISAADDAEVKRITAGAALRWEAHDELYDAGLWLLEK